MSELEDIVRMGADLGFRNVNFLDPIPVDEITAAQVPSETEFAELPCDELSELGRSLGIGVSWQTRRKTGSSARHQRCLHPWNTVFIRADGNVQPCPALFGTDRAAVMGNILQEGFAELWNGQSYREYRRGNRLRTNALCRVCPYN
jgi:radical SAM protein with 4Fe4S-binding SPASM domain